MGVLFQLLIIILLIFLLAGAREVVNNHVFAGLVIILLLVWNARSSAGELSDNFSIQLLTCHYERVHFLTVLP
jgi:hypothetical protein